MIDSMWALVLWAKYRGKNEDIMCDRHGIWHVGHHYQHLQGDLRMCACGRTRRFK